MSRHTPGMRRWLLTIEEENKMTTQPEALRMADDLERWPDANVSNRSFAAAAEMRRLHEAHEWQYTMAGQRLRRIEKLEAINQELLAALREIDNWLVCACIATPEDMAQSFTTMQQMASAAINKAERTTT